MFLSYAAGTKTLLCSRWSTSDELDWGSGSPMADDDIRYELKTVRTIRGTEARTTAKWQKDGWELLTQSQGRLQTQITFRRPKAKLPLRLLAVSGGVVLLIIVFAVIMGAIQGAGGSSEPTTSPTQDAVTQSAPPTEEPTDEPTPSEPAKEEVLTVKNNKDLAALLAGPDQGSAVKEFAAEYEGQLIEFDGNISAMANHNEYQTRYDILISAGDFSETRSTGPNFQFRDVNTTYDLHLTGANIPDSIGVRDNLHLVARVGDFDPEKLLFYLEPISTQFR